MSGTALTLAALAAMVLGCAGVGAVGQVARSHAEVDAVADLAALAVAARSSRGETAERACASGGAVARAAGARLVGCRAESRPLAGVAGGVSAVVTVSVDVSVWGTGASVSGTARAGPVP